MRRILSALVLLPIVLGAVWWLPSAGTLLLAEVVGLLAYVEYAALVERQGVRVPRVVTGAGVAAACAALGLGARVDVVLLVATIGIALSVLASGSTGGKGLHEVSAALFAVLYLGLPLGALVAIHAAQGRAAVLTLLLTVMASDVAQYYGGRALGRRLLAPSLSPRKTQEGALAGLVGGTAALVGLGRWLMPGTPMLWLVSVGAVVVMLGIAGDLFESMLKRGAGLKDASGLIPGHGGMLDRVDSLLFAAPVFYVLVTYARHG